MKRIGILTSGGDAPGMNTAIRALTLVAAQRGIEVIGIERGYHGLMERKYRPLVRMEEGSLIPTGEVETMAHLGGSFLGSARCKEFYEAKGRAIAAENAKRDFDGLIVIGGNGSLTGAHFLFKEHGIRYIGIPASIDNDVGCTSLSIGVDTALNTIVEACDRISDTARTHRRAFVVEVMGRQSGYLCMASAIAVGADAALYREDGRSEEELVKAVADTIRRGFVSVRNKQRILIIKAEGVEMPCTRMVRQVQEQLDKEPTEIEIRAVVLGHLVRGGNPSFLDRMIASRFALVAIDALANGQTDQMVAWQSRFEGASSTLDRSITLWSLPRVLDETSALLDGSSPVTRARVGMMQKAAGVLSL